MKREAETERETERQRERQREFLQTCAYATITQKEKSRYQLVKHAKEAAIIVIPLPRLSFFFSFHLLMHF
jgi:hypothetical protein